MKKITMKMSKNVKKSFFYMQNREKYVNLRPKKVLR